MKKVKIDYKYCYQPYTNSMSSDLSEYGLERSKILNLNSIKCILLNNMRRRMNIILISVIFISFCYLIGCSDNSVNNTVSQRTTIFQKPGLIDSLIGTCSTYLIHTIPLDTVDFRNYENIGFSLDAMTDGDLSGLSIYFVRADTGCYLINLNGRNEINNTKYISIPSPKIREKLIMRLKLFASVCTGENYHLRMKDLKISGYGN
jgi:hypothetical protein